MTVLRILFKVHNKYMIMYKQNQLLVYPKELYKCSSQNKATYYHPSSIEQYHSGQ